jgi:hypothetical protein
MRILTWIGRHGGSCFDRPDGNLAAAIRLWLALLAAALLMAAPADAQDHLWSQLIGGSGDSVGSAVATDAAGNVVLAGHFNGELVIGGDTFLASTSTTDTFVGKLSSAGVPLWTTQLGGIGNNPTKGVAVDADGNVAVVSESPFDIALTFLDGSDGSVLWSRAFTDAEVAVGVGFDSNGNIVLVGDFRDTVDFGGGGLTSVGSYDVVVASYNASDGSHRWSRHFGGSGAELADAMAIGPDDTIVIAGNFSTATDFGSGPHSPVGGSDVFVAAYDAIDGAPLWSRTAGGTGFDAAQGVGVDPLGNVFLTGYFGLFGSAINFGGGPLPAAGGADVFLAKYSSAGTVLWASGYGGSGDDYATDVAVDSAGRPIVTGYFQLTANLGGGPLTSAGQSDIFLAGYASNGHYLWSQRYGNLVNEKGLAVAVDSSNAIIGTGFTQWNVDFGGGLLTNSGKSDAYLVKLGSDEEPPLTPTPTPSPTPESTPGEICSSSPDPGCVAGFAKGLLMINDVPGKEKLVAKMLGGPELSQTDMGNPLDSLLGGTGTAFALCIYAANQALIGEMIVDRAGGTCADGNPCWKSIGKPPTDPTGPGKGYNYKDANQSSSGIQRIMYRGGHQGKSKTLINGKGPNLPVELLAQLQGSASATVQLRSSDGICLSVTLQSFNKRAFKKIN